MGFLFDEIWSFCCDVRLLHLLICAKIVGWNPFRPFHTDGLAKLTNHKMRVFSEKQQMGDEDLVWSYMILKVSVCFACGSKSWRELSWMVYPIGWENIVFQLGPSIDQLVKWLCLTDKSWWNPILASYIPPCLDYFGVVFHIVGYIHKLHH